MYDALNIVLIFLLGGITQKKETPDNTHRQNLLTFKIKIIGITAIAIIIMLLVKKLYEK